MGVLGYSEPARGLRKARWRWTSRPVYMGWPDVGFGIAQMGRAATRASNIELRQGRLAP